MNSSDEGAITEITIGRDGRVYVFGLSREVLGVLAGLFPGSSFVGDRVSRASEQDRKSNTESLVSAVNGDQLRRRKSISVRRAAAGPQL